MTIEIQQKRPYGTPCYRPVIKDASDKIVWEGNDYPQTDDGRVYAMQEAVDKKATLEEDKPYSPFSESMEYHQSIGS